MPVKEIANFSVSYMQILDEKGNLDVSLEPDLSADVLLKLYRYMALAREVDERQIKLQRQGRIGTFPPSIGQEAVPAAAALAMQDKDWFVDAYRTLAGRLLRGEKISTQLHLWSGFEEGNLDDNTARTLPTTIVLGTQLAPAVGIAYAMRFRGEKDSCVVTFFGDGSSSEGDSHEAMNFAAVWQVPVVFILVNNQWAISTPRKIQCHAKTLAQRAISYDMPAIQIDGNDPLAVYAAVKEALDRGRSGGGPTLIEAVTYRMSMHTTADDPTKYRSDEEVNAWKEKDPLTRFRIYLQNKGIWDDQKQAAMEQDIGSEISKALEEFENIEIPAPDAPFDYIYGTSHAEIEDQRSEFLASLKEEIQNA